MVVRKERSTETVLATRATEGYAYKIGEVPTFGPPVPAKAITLVGPDRELFLKGRNAENQGFGIGAFAYYRRVVENQKDRILAEIIRVAEKTRADADMIQQLRDARQETQFRRAVDMVKDSLPPALLIDGHYNPLVLLHNALSRDLHTGTDEHCLETAADIREVLYELAERIGQALKDQNELNRAVGRLLNKS